MTGQTPPPSSSSSSRVPPLQRSQTHSNFMDSTQTSRKKQTPTIRPPLPTHTPPTSKLITGGSVILSTSRATEEKTALVAAQVTSQSLSSPRKPNSPEKNIPPSSSISAHAFPPPLHPSASVNISLSSSSSLDSTHLLSSSTEGPSSSPTSSSSASSSPSKKVTSQSTSTPNSARAPAPVPDLAPTALLNPNEEATKMVRSLFQETLSSLQPELLTLLSQNTSPFLEESSHPDPQKIISRIEKELTALLAEPPDETMAIPESFKQSIQRIQKAPSSEKTGAEIKKILKKEFVSRIKEMAVIAIIIRQSLDSLPSNDRFARHTLKALASKLVNFFYAPETNSGILLAFHQRMRELFVHELIQNTAEFKPLLEIYFQKEIKNAFETNLLPSLIEMLSLEFPGHQEILQNINAELISENSSFHTQIKPLLSQQKTNNPTTVCETLLSSLRAEIQKRIRQIAFQSVKQLYPEASWIVDHIFQEIEEVLKKNPSKNQIDAFIHEAKTLKELFLSSLMGKKKEDQITLLSAKTHTIQENLQLFQATLKVTLQKFPLEVSEKIQGQAQSLADAVETEVSKTLKPHPPIPASIQEKLPIIQERLWWGSKITDSDEETYQNFFYHIFRAEIKKSSSLAAAPQIPDSTKAALHNVIQLLESSNASADGTTQTTPRDAPSTALLQSPLPESTPPSIGPTLTVAINPLPTALSPRQAAPIPLPCPSNAHSSALPLSLSSTSLSTTPLSPRAAVPNHPQLPSSPSISSLLSSVDPNILTFSFSDTNLPPSIDTLSTTTETVCLLGNVSDPWLGAMIQKSPQIKKVHFRDCTKDFGQSLLLLREFTQLTFLSLSNINASHKNLHLLFSQTKSRDSLQTIEISNLPISDEVIAWIALLPKLEHLALNGCHELTSLTMLHLRNCKALKALTIANTPGIDPLAEADFREYYTRTHPQQSLSFNMTHHFDETILSFIFAQTEETLGSSTGVHVQFLTGRNPSQQMSSEDLSAIELAPIILPGLRDEIQKRLGQTVEQKLEETLLKLWKARIEEQTWESKEGIRQALEQEGNQLIKNQIAQLQPQAFDISIAESLDIFAQTTLKPLLQSMVLQQKNLLPREKQILNGSIDKQFTATLPGEIEKIVRDKSSQTVLWVDCVLQSYFNIHRFVRAIFKELIPFSPGPLSTIREIFTFLTQNIRRVETLNLQSSGITFLPTIILSTLSSWNSLKTIDLRKTNLHLSIDQAAALFQLPSDKAKTLVIETNEPHLTDVNETHQPTGPSSSTAESSKPSLLEKLFRKKKP